jgi:deoxycytidine triphosphate deaminase
MTCTHPFLLHPAMRIGQVEFETVRGDICLYEGSYKKQEGPTGSRMGNYFKDGKPL